MGTYVQPVMTPDESEAAQIVLRAVLAKRILVEHDADKVRGALEAFTHAPVMNGRVPVDPSANEMGKFARRSPESRKAALANFPRSGTQRMAILERIAAAGQRGMTREEVGRALRMSGDTVRPRMLELVEGGWLTAARDENGDMTRATLGGNDAAVLVATERAKGKLAAAHRQVVTKA